MRFVVVIWANQFLRKHLTPLELAGLVANKVFTDFKKYVIFYLWTIQKFAFYRRSHCMYTTLWGALGNRNSLTVQILWHVNFHCVLHNISQFSLPVSCRFIDGKVGENVEALFILFSKYKLSVYGIQLWTKTARLIYFLFGLCGLKLPVINDAPVRQCILFRFEGNLFKLISG